MPDPDRAQTAYDLVELPEGSKLRSVIAVPVDRAGHRALRVELTDAVTLQGKPGVDYVDMPTFVIIPADFKNGTIEVDILSRLNGKGPADARAFAGIAYRITDGGDHFEAVYLRPLNGLKTIPPSPRDKRAMQYFAYPDWKFDRLREEYPDGRYEAAANIGPGEWITLKIDIDGTQVTVTVNDIERLSLTETKATPVAGAVGLFVDIGSESFFSNLKITRR
jgi:3-keto-disaccharide hydrolase